MYSLGLVSVSFRDQSPETVVAAAKAAGLNCIEWVSDAHAPYDRDDILMDLAALQEASGIRCCSYGTQFILGRDHPQELRSYIRAAKLLNTNVLRLWCGRKHSEDFSPRELEALYRQCRTAAALAEAEGVTLCMECHNTTLTNRKEGALDLMLAVNSPNFRMYWQPNHYLSDEENLAYAWLLAPYTNHVHVFNWHAEGEDTRREPLAGAVPLWREYLKNLTGDRTLLLEYMPDNRLESLPVEAEALRRIAE